MNTERLKWDFDYHAPNPQKVELHQAVREHCRITADTWNDMVVDCRELSLAITKLEEAMFWMNAALARGGHPDETK